MLAAGLLAKRAVQKGLKVNPMIKTSLAPGSRVVTDYLKKGAFKISGCAGLRACRVWMHHLHRQQRTS